MDEVILEQRTLGDPKLGRRVVWDGVIMRFYMGQEYKFSLNPEEQIELAEFMEELMDKYM